MPSILPWEVHPHLTEDRLKVVGKLLAEVREEALLEFNPARGDGTWSHGCRVYERSCARLTQAAGVTDWLDVVEPPLHFVFGIGRVPIRFYHGVPEAPRLGSLLRSPVEQEQQQEAFTFIDAEDDGWFWRMAVVSDGDGGVAEVVILQARDSGETRRPWSIPLAEPVSVLSGLGSIPDAVELPPPVVEVLTSIEEADEEDSRDN